MSEWEVEPTTEQQQRDYAIQTAILLENYSKVIRSAVVARNLELIDWNNLVDAVETSFDTLLTSLGKFERLELEDSGIVSSDEDYDDEPDFYDDEVQ